MNSVGDAFGLAFKDPEWLGKIALQGLITIIPIVGWIATAGWMIMNFDNFRSGRYVLAPAGFHLERGFPYFAVVFIYGFVINLPGSILSGVTFRFPTNVNGFNGYYSSSPFAPLGSLYSFAASLFLDFLLPSLIVVVYHSGFSGGMDVQRVWRYATSNVNNSVMCGLLMFVASLIAVVGFCACCIGVFFTAVYASTVQAGVAAWFERVQSAPAAPAGTPSV